MANSIYILFGVFAVALVYVAVQTSNLELRSKKNEKMIKSKKKSLDETVTEIKRKSGE